MEQDRTMQYMAIAMKYLPEAQQMLDETGLELEPQHIQPLVSLLTKVMDEAYELGKQNALDIE
ncbi:ComZ family protein [Sutcliffiella horikoshii]|uniref:ComZ family protein n=1 Tax=Sutcliffiella horikoshii TaxID=79883 RepID=UPI0007D0A485|nr:ComZ family protein [Sutcliffiella horikoshii]MCM3616878.1 ComZ family protein [Sutcliffiella horikoshii]